MNIGYACLTIGVPNTDMKSCIMKNATNDKLKELIDINLKALNNILDYNIQNDIRLFRISSDLIPFGSSQVNLLPWWEIFEKEFQLLGKKIKDYNLRVSMHPGQYTVLNSPDDGIVQRAIADLDYHSKVLECLQTGSEHKIILHIGGAYNDKEKAMERFRTNYLKLEDSIKKRLVIENDDKIYNISEVLTIGKNLGIPVVFDNLHHSANPSKENKLEREWIYECSKTWRSEDGPQKIHYSQQNTLKKPGSHSEGIKIAEFMDFYNRLQGMDPDIMLEVKDKNLSAVKCINSTAHNKSILALESEWSRYQYSVLEHSQNDYQAIIELLKDKSSYPAFNFYQIIEEALQKPLNVGEAMNAVMHVWGYFKDVVSGSDKDKFLNELNDYRLGNQTLAGIKNLLWKYSVKYQRDYLLNSYYFILYNR